MHDWGWRLPFLLAAPMGLIGRYIRTQAGGHPRHSGPWRRRTMSPAPRSWRRSGRTGAQLVLALGAAVLNAVAFYVLLSYMPTYLSTELGFGATESFLATTIALATYIGFIFLTGMASDRYGRKKMLIPPPCCSSSLTVPAFTLLDGAQLPAHRLSSKSCWAPCSPSMTAPCRASWPRCSRPASATPASR